MKNLKNELCCNPHCEGGVVDLGGHMGITSCSICEDIEENMENYAKQRAIEEMEKILDRTQLATKVEGVRLHIASQITKLKQ